VVGVEIAADLEEDRVEAPALDVGEDGAHGVGLVVGPARDPDAAHLAVVEGVGRVAAVGPAIPARPAIGPAAVAARAVGRPRAGGVSAAAWQALADAAVGVGAGPEAPRRRREQ
ncbi:MAG: hypothetical protein ACK559_33945, partial [bacterium]